MGEDRSRARGGVLGKAEILKRIRLDVESPSYLGVVPFSKRLVQTASLDVRLGHRFGVPPRSSLAFVGVGDLCKSESGNWERVFVPDDQEFVIHPGSIVVGTTLEFVSLPADVLAFVEGKSSIGRMGLLVATATQVAPGFHGVVVLELVNAGSVPVVVEPGQEIAQLVFFSLTAPVRKEDLYRSRHYCQVDPWG